MQEKDITQKMLERHNDVFSDIVNVLLFGGKKVVAEETLFDSVTDSVLKIDKRVRIQDRDVAKYWKDSQINIALFGLENQTTPNKLMPLRVISYDGTEYGKQSRTENIDKKKYPVISLVLYLGFEQKWLYPKNLLGIIDVDEKLKPYVNDYKINLFEIAYLDREIIDSFKSDFWILADYLYQMRVNKNYVADKKSIAHVEELLMLMSAMTGDKRFEEIIDEANTKEVVNMCEVLDIVEARGIEKGIEKGREKGREEGADIISRLNTILAKEGDLDKIIKANTDKKYRNELLKKYNLLRDYEK
ncbi:transposase, YhgA-like domain protein [Lachnoanaerobaculum sp. ICM7]|uniref:Rpn family recombination-promoting nuclease/putative transposase n=1 Tax=Lachnoanaerobaculum sp. ICM7 TaxID=936594 RepID=UPI00027A4867|nr:Rpn family recombination-promoting nuclease/putative transposase [Lachnoanaerobaculum sp. ICM7]EJP23240.1 transposase, YhgA-like domain protein [Lachnoanaerobaculum sp. ICM7]